MGVGCWASDGSPSILFRLVDLRSWFILVIAVKQHQFFCFWPITAQSDTEAQGKIACCPSDRPDNMVQQLAGVDQHHVRCRCAIDRDPKTLDEHCFTATCSAFVEMTLNPPAPFPRLMYVCSPNCSAGTAVPPSVCRHMCAPFTRSFFAVVGRFSMFLRYQVM